ncbi:enoyl-CoA hydratase/isomerase family protein [bacterium]|nr:enoyl-CoA hydratase/isomerase family protein [bacterium]
MSQDIIIYQEIGHVALVTFNQPDKLNALDDAMGDAFQKILARVEANKDIRVMVITGAGRAFSSGGNLDMLEDRVKRTPETNKRELMAFYQLFLDMRKIRVPVIAAINGPAVGAGFCMTLASDLRYAAKGAKLGANFSKLGLAPGMGGTYLVTRLAGPVNAAEILMLGELFTAERALDMGLINGVFDPDQLLAEVQKIAEKLAANAPISVAAIKKGIQRAQHETLEELFEYDSSMQAQCFTTEDIKEGILAIREKRAPWFKGK